jgi:hypothetical protein
MRFALFCRLEPGCGSVGEQAHVLFGEGERSLVWTYMMLDEEVPAQKRQFLEANAILVSHADIRPDGENRARPVCRNAFKSEYPDSGDLAESPQCELHRLVFHRSLLSLSVAVPSSPPRR